MLDIARRRGSCETAPSAKCSFAPNGAENNQDIPGFQADLFAQADAGRVVYPAAPGCKERSFNSASRRAAEMIEPVAGTLRALALECLREKGALTSDECAAVLGFDVLSIRPRFSELRRLGKIVATDDRRPSSRGTPQTVWRTAP